MQSGYTYKRGEGILISDDGFLHANWKNNTSIKSENVFVWTEKEPVPVDLDSEKFTDGFYSGTLLNNEYDKGYLINKNVLYIIDKEHCLKCDEGSWFLGEKLDDRPITENLTPSESIYRGLSYYCPLKCFALGEYQVDTLYFSKRKFNVGNIYTTKKNTVTTRSYGSGDEDYNRLFSEEAIHNFSLLSRLHEWMERKGKYSFVSTNAF